MSSFLPVILQYLILVMYENVSSHQLMYPFILIIVTICVYFYYTLHIKRLARMVLHNTWSICCFMGQTLLLKIPQGTLHFTFRPSITRQVYGIDASCENIIATTILMS